MEITLKLDKGEDPAQAYDLIRRGLSGFYILRSTTKNSEAGTVTFKFTKKSHVASIFPSIIRFLLLFSQYFP